MKPKPTIFLFYTNSTNVCLCVEVHPSQTLHLICCKPGKNILNGPGKHTVEFGTIWTRVTFNIKTLLNWINRRPALCSGESGYFSALKNSYFLPRSQLLVPLLSNRSNHTEWPQVVCEDVVRNVHSLKNDVFVVSGQVQGKTLLPLPMDFERVEQAALEMGKR